MCQFVVLIYYYIEKYCELNKPKIMQQNYCNFTHSKKKVVVEIMQFEQIKNTIVSRNSLFLYMDNIYIYKQIGVLEKKNKIHLT